MRRLIGIFALVLLTGGVEAAEQIRVTTWNLGWFPRGFRGVASTEEESQRIQEAAQVLSPLNADVLLLQGVQDWATCEKLAAALRPQTFHVLVCSAFKESWSQNISRQQIAILSRRPAFAAWSENFENEGQVALPRGHAFAGIRFGAQAVGFYAVYLKSNQSNTRGELANQLNILKRELAAEQLVQGMDAQRDKATNQFDAFVIGGTFNTNPDESIYLSERTLRVLEEAGFSHGFQKVPLFNRVTCAAKGKYPESTADYIFVRQAMHLIPPQVAKSELAEHYPLTAELLLLEPARPVQVVQNTPVSPNNEPRTVAEEVAPPPPQPAPPPSPANSPAAEIIAPALTNAPLVPSTPVPAPVAFTTSLPARQPGVWWWWLALVVAFHLLAFLLLRASRLRKFSTIPASHSGSGMVAADPISPATFAEQVVVSPETEAKLCDALNGPATDQTRALVRTALIPHLARMMMDKLVGALLSQRTQLLNTQQTGAQQVAELEARLAKIQEQLQERYRNYEQRIAELERRLSAKEVENRELRSATMRLDSEKLARAEAEASLGVD